MRGIPAGNSMKGGANFAPFVPFDVGRVMFGDAPGQNFEKGQTVRLASDE
jgi:hypothetical protein